MTLLAHGLKVPIAVSEGKTSQSPNRCCGTVTANKNSY